MRKEFNMKFSNKLVLPVLAMSLITGSSSAGAMQPVQRAKNAAGVFVATLFLGTVLTGSYLALETISDLFGGGIHDLVRVAQNKAPHKKEEPINPVYRFGPALLFGSTILGLAAGIQNPDNLF